MNDFDFSTSQQIQFINHRTINWKDVRRTRFLFYQRFEYAYPGPIYNLKQRLVVVPAPQYGAQHLRDHHLEVSPSPKEIRKVVDSFGNCVLELELPEADKNVSFESFMIVENVRDTDHKQSPISAAEARHWLQPTALTMPDARILSLALAFKNESATPHEMAEQINLWVHGALRYEWDVTAVNTTAAEALTLGRGLCQDYSHLMVSICRAAGLPARYVSGHMLGDGGSHAWVEVFLPTDEGLCAFAFDPTNNRRPYLDYVTVAVGRDYRDVAPTSGTFTASYGGELTCGKHAGLIQVEYVNGEVLESQYIH